MWRTFETCVDHCYRDNHQIFSIRLSLYGESMVPPSITASKKVARRVVILYDRVYWSALTTDWQFTWLLKASSLKLASYNV